MERTPVWRRVVAWILIPLLVGALLVGCNALKTSQPSSASEAAGYSGGLDTSYQGALDPMGQLALGTLKLEGTADAVTEEQAVALLPLWQALQGSALQGEAERNAVLKGIEATMGEEQIAAIAAMRLTAADAQTWAREQGGFPAAGGDQAAAGGGQTPGGRQRPEGTPSSGMPEGRGGQFQNLTPEELATRRAQFAGARAAGGATTLPTGGTSRLLIGPLMALLAERSGVSIAGVATPTPPPTATALPTLRSRPAASPTPESTPVPTDKPTATPEPAPMETPTAATSPTPEPVVYVVQAGDSLAAIAQAYGITVAAVIEANGLADANLIRVGQELLIPNPARTPTRVVGARTAASAGSDIPAGDVDASLAPGLKRLEDKAPGPPFTIQVSANVTTQDPLVEKSQRHKITGIVRNDGDQTYAVSALHVTFYDASGFRGTFRKYPFVPGGEWLWHGQIEAEMACLLLAPGEACPFIVEITAQDMASFLIHPDAVPTERASASVELSDIKLNDDYTNYLRLTGTASNGNPFPVKNVTVSGVLVDANGQITSVGSTYVLQEDILPGASVRFDLRIPEQAYTSYRLYAQAERD